MDINIPSGSVSLTSSSGNVAAAAAVATLAAGAQGRNYVTGFIITSAGATVGLPVVATLSGVVGGTMSFIYSAPAGALIGGAPYMISFPIPIAASADVTPIVLTLPSLGAGNTNAAVVLTGFRL
jgi:hypothetical protein